MSRRANPTLSLDGAYQLMLPISGMPRVIVARAALY